MYSNTGWKPQDLDWE